jgi:predicted patatin/cPLA2 family phospholipase
MRGVVGGGMVSALEERGLLGCFDTVHGSSAGACVGAYFVAGQARLGTRIYYEDINNRKFIDPKRLWMGRAIMNTHFLIDEVMRSAKPLAVDRIVGNPGLVHIVATDGNTGESREFSKFPDAEYFFKVLKGSITIPIVAGRAITVDGVPLLDGGIVQQIALKSALAAGATHVLVLLTRREGELARPELPSRMEHLALSWAYGRQVAAAYWRRNGEINSVLKQIYDNESPGISLAAVARSKTAVELDRLTIDAELLQAADREAREAVFRFLE